MPGQIHKFRGTSVRELDVVAFKRSALPRTLLISLERRQSEALAILRQTMQEARTPVSAVESPQVEELKLTFVEDATAESWSFETVETVTEDGRVIQESRRTKKVAEPVGHPELIYGQVESSEAETEIAAFLESGWLVVPARSVAPDFGLGHKTYCYDDGQLTIGLDRLLVRFKRRLTDYELEGRLKPFELTVVGEIQVAPNQPSILTVTVPNGTAFEKAEELSALSELEYAEPDMVEYLPSRAMRHQSPEPPPDAGERWHTTKIQAEQAWQRTLGEDVTVAILDHGFCLSSAHFRSAVSDKGGWLWLDCSDKLVVSNDQRLMPFGQHGTFCAGMAVGRPESRDGWRGVAPAAMVLPLARYEHLSGSQRDGVVAALEYLLNPKQKVHVICCSLGVERFKVSSALLTMLESAAHARDGRGIPIFWAVANNDGSRRPSIGLDMVCSSGHVIPVGASDWDDNAYGAYGPALAFLAPGIQVYGPLPRGPLVPDSGTSFAAPCAAAVAALMLAANSDLKAIEIRQLMEEGCDKVGSDTTSTRDDYVGHGRINAGRAVDGAVGAKIMADVVRRVKGKKPRTR